MTYSATIHQNGNKKGLNNSNGASIEHNTRTTKYKHDREQFISQGIEQVINLDLQQTYNEIFGESTQRYNEKQKDERRKITSHFDKMKDNKQKHLFYEMIFSIGTKDDRGIREYEQEIKPKFSKVCKKLIQEINQNYGNNIKVFSATIHYDEVGAYHMHLDYIPIAHNYKNGQDTQANIDRALQECGFKDKEKNGKPITPQQAFCEEVQSIYDTLLEVEDIKIKEHGQGRKASLTKEQYSAEKEKMKSELIQEHKFLSSKPKEYAEILQIKKNYESDLMRATKGTLQEYQQVLEDISVERTKLKAEQKAYTKLKNQVDEKEKELDTIIETKSQERVKAIFIRKQDEVDKLKKEIKDLEETRANIQTEQEKLNNQLTNDKVLRDMSIKKLTEEEKAEREKLKADNNRLSSENSLMRATLESLAETCTYLKNPNSFIDKFKSICQRTWKYAEKIIETFTTRFQAKEQEQAKKQAPEHNNGFSR